MLRSRNKPISVSAGFYILIAVYLLVIPFRWVAAWLLASAAHELGHCVALRICKVNIFSFYITPFGAKIQTEPMTPGCEAFAAMSGPLSGMLLLLFARYCPRVAICAIVQSAFNLLPIYPMDGGRILHSIFAICMPNCDPRFTDYIVKAFGFILVLLLIGLLLFYRRIQITLYLLFFLILTILGRNNSCKDGTLGLQ